MKAITLNIDHAILLDLLRKRVRCPVILSIVKDICERLVWTRGYYESIKDKSIPRGCSMSPLLAAIYLMPLDHAIKNVKDIFYVRYMDDYVFMTKSKAKLRKAIKEHHRVLGELKLTVAKDKTFIGRVARGFSFLGYEIALQRCRVSLTSLQRCLTKTVKLKEKGACEERLLQYWQNWQRWAQIQNGLSCDAISAPTKCLMYVMALTSYAMLGSLFGQMDFFVKFI